MLRQESGGGQQPDWKDKWGPGDYLWSATQRAGLLGVGQFAVDGIERTTSLGGPTVEQFAEGAGMLGGREQFKHFALRALPANALYAQALGGQATDPTFAE